MYNFSNNKYTGRKKLFDYEKLLNNSAEQAKKATDKAELLSSTLAPKNSFNGKTAAKPTIPGPISSDNVAELLSFDLTSGLKKNESKNPRNSGAIIKQRLAKFLSDSTGKDYSKAFDSIDDRLVEKNIPLADDTVQKNTSKRAYHGDYPNMRDGMALFYAASEANDSKTAKLARQAAYTENKSEKSKIAQKPLFSDDNNKSFNILSLFNEYGKKSQKAKDVNPTRYVVGTGVRLRAQPGTSSKILTSMDFGTSVEYTGNKTDMINGYRWAEVEYNGKKGWVADILLGINDPVEAAKKQAELERQKRERIRYVGKNGVSLRSDPHTRSTNIDVLNSGDSVEFTGEKIKSLNRLWAQVVYNGKTGWVEANDLRISNGFMVNPNVPNGLFVENQTFSTEERTKKLNENIPVWLAETTNDISYVDQSLIDWFTEHGAKVRYTGSYCLPLKKFSRITQGFYGRTSHAGSSTKNREFGKYGAIDIAADRGEPIYSVLPGKVVYIAKNGADHDFHRITIETKINGEIFYLEYLHSDKIDVKLNQEVYAGDQIATVGGWGRENGYEYGPHLDFRIYQFQNSECKNYSSDSSKKFYDPFEFFDFDEKYGFNLERDDYH